MKLSLFRQTRFNHQIFKGDDGRYHLLIQIRNIRNGRIYVCIHSTKNPYDNYMGSGKEIKEAISKEGIDNFKKTIIHSARCREELKFLEKIIVDKYFIKTMKTYNLAIGGSGNNYKKEIKKVDTISSSALKNESLEEEFFKTQHNVFYSLKVISIKIFRFILKLINRVCKATNLIFS